MDKILNNGPGICRGTHRLVIKPVMAAISLGSSPDVINDALRSVHRINRNGRPDDFIAVAFPLMGRHLGEMHTGHELEVIGSDRVLQELVDSDVVRSMVSRGMIESIEIEEVMVGIGEVGVAYYRDHKPAKHTEGWLRRTKARAERRGKALGKPVAVRPYETAGLISLRYGDALLHVAEKLATFEGGDIVVNTYGFSTATQPSVLPVRPSASKLERHEQALDRAA